MTATVKTATPQALVEKLLAQLGKDFFILRQNEIGERGARYGKTIFTVTGPEISPANITIVITEFDMKAAFSYQWPLDDQGINVGIHMFKTPKEIEFIGPLPELFNATITRPAKTVAKLVREKLVERLIPFIPTVQEGLQDRLNHTRRNVENLERLATALGKDNKWLMNQIAKEGTIRLDYPVEFRVTKNDHYIRTSMNVSGSIDVRIDSMAPHTAIEMLSQI